MSEVSRRQLIRYGGSLIGTGFAATILGSQLAKANDSRLLADSLPDRNQAITPDEAIAKLLEGNQRFAGDKRLNPHQDRQRVTEIAETQAPFAAILGCADSRVPAEIIFDQGLGDLFVCRVAGNIATSEEIGSLEYAAMILGAKAIVVLGHTHCGAVKVTLQGGRLPGQLGHLIDGIQVAVERADAQTGENKLERAVKANIVYQTQKVLTSDIIFGLSEKKQIKVVGAYYDLNTGKVNLLG
ncbi:carbonic anhydrase [Pannus brasiliensis CCIBt3594]|uniref:carbonic anhydrase n=1 Tax=Pannus brasiliensis CCIBt3594 TaxID=1427578 RepID=A0AAW9QLE0_9CHRO